jgi:hypothetical protein
MRSGELYFLDGGLAFVDEILAEGAALFVDGYSAPDSLSPAV